MNARPIYKKLLVAALVIYIIGTTYTITMLCHTIGKLEHELHHLSESH